MGRPLPVPVPCQVCGDKSFGKHYGVYCCDGCSCFFKRTVRKNVRHRCIGLNDRCTVDKSRRNWCPSCRFQKCLTVSMNPFAVQEERGPRRSKENSNNTHVRGQRKQAPTILAQRTKSSTRESLSIVPESNTAAAATTNRSAAVSIVNKQNKASPNEALLLGDALVSGQFRQLYDRYTDERTIQRHLNHSTDKSNGQVCWNYTPVTLNRIEHGADPLHHKTTVASPAATPTLSHSCMNNCQHSSLSNVQGVRRLHPTIDQLVNGCSFVQAPNQNTACPSSLGANLWTPTQEKLVNRQFEPRTLLATAAATVANKTHYKHHQIMDQKRGHNNTGQATNDDDAHDDDPSNVTVQLTRQTPTTPGTVASIENTSKGVFYYYYYLYYYRLIMSSTVHTDQQTLSNNTVHQPNDPSQATF